MTIISKVKLFILILLIKCNYSNVYLEEKNILKNQLVPIEKKNIELQQSLFLIEYKKLVLSNFLKEKNFCEDIKNLIENYWDIDVILILHNQQALIYSPIFNVLKTVDIQKTELSVYLSFFFSKYFICKSSFQGKKLILDGLKNTTINQNANVIYEFGGLMPNCIKDNKLNSNFFLLFDFKDLKLEALDQDHAPPIWNHYKLKKSITSYHLNSSGDILALEYYNSNYCDIIHLKTNNHLCLNHDKQITNMYLGTNNIAICDSENNISIWDLNNGNLLRILPQKHNNYITNITFSETGNFIVSLDTEEINIWNLIDGCLINTSLFQNNIIAVCFIMNDNFFITKDEINQKLIVWNTFSFNKIFDNQINFKKSNIFYGTI